MASCGRSWTGRWRISSLIPLTYEPHPHPHPHLIVALILTTSLILILTVTSPHPHLILTLTLVITPSSPHPHLFVHRWLSLRPSVSPPTQPMPPRRPCALASTSLRSPHPHLVLTHRLTITSTSTNLTSSSCLRDDVDVAQVDPCFGPLADALDRQLVNISDIDNAVRRVLNHKFSAGLFDTPYIDETIVLTQAAAFPLRYI